MADVPTMNFRSLQIYLGRFEQKLKPVLEVCDIKFDYNLKLEKIPYSNKFELPKFAEFTEVKQRGSSRKSKKLNIILPLPGRIR